MPARFNTPNIFIYLGALFRPTKLQPHLRVPSITHLDFRALRKAGFNAVVIDKDNCLTLPEEDEIYPPLQTAWNQLLTTFEPGRVLLVSNSAGTLKKDPESIAAEAVSLSLRCPVLLHPRPKPGCADLIIRYFTGSLGTPTTIRSQIAQHAEDVRKQEVEDERYMIKHLESLVSGPLLGPLVDKDGKEIKPSTILNLNNVKDGDNKLVEERMSIRQRESSEKKADEKATHKAEERATKKGLIRSKEDRAKDALRILVIGDRLFTDTLLANRLDSLLPPKKPSESPTTDTTISDSTSSSPLQSPLSIPSVISIHTTLLPQPKDVRFLRWIEDKLSGGRLRSGPIDWGRFMIDTTPALTTAVSAPTWRERLNPFRDTPPLTWHPRSWRPAPLVVGMGQGVYWISSMVGRGLLILLQRAWAGEVEVAKVLVAKAQGEEKKIELAAGEVQKAEKEASTRVLTQSHSTSIS